ncbi:PaaI family thioesterase [Methylibium rhizosphaerae]|uniref:PaaI family thioesterase n=1 Tax=Methylibium rhizosphaerae TaxID=2570323 RepID=UPI00112ABA27|nr:PaaI family thioesterase [Methylibium rhizosphaerae]
MHPADSNYEARVRASLARQAAMATLGVSLEAVAPGRVVLAMAHRSAYTQQHGFVHAGIVSTALDSACGYAAFSLMPPDAAVLTIEFKVNLLAPAKGPHFRFEGQVVKPGRTISVVDGRALQFDTDGQEKLVATMTATVMTVTGRDDVKH